MPESHATQPPSRFSRLAPWTFWVLAFLACLVPAQLGLDDAGLSDLRGWSALGTLSGIALLAALFGLLRPRLAGLLAVLALCVMLLVRISFFGLVQFAGHGFTNEVFIHLEVESLRVAWNEYRVLFLLAFGALPVLIAMMLAYSRQLTLLSRRAALVVALLALTGVAAGRSGLPEWMLAESMYRWYSPKRLAMPEDELQRWRDSGLVEVDLRKKGAFEAHAPASPLNLILLYVESGGLRVIDHPDHPGLMPTLARLQREHALVPHVHASGYITIEGIVNSQCGTLFPFERESESLAGFDGVAEELPCLGDVLAAAGYRQSYLGGAESSFAGKGNFLRAHGYDTVKGLRHWLTHGLQQRPDTWGLSDVDLFEQSLVELASLRASGHPFNLTLLTIGTHLPGYSYAECTPYGDGTRRFLDALHCTDQLIGRWLVRLEAEGYLRDSVVVITADHHVFPNPEMQRLFGKDATEDRRLPLIVLGAGAGARRAAVQEGAGFDLAPTVLDLLGVEHDARFALGRSLLREQPAREFFATRYLDVFRGRAADPPTGDCTDPVALPLTRCDKDSLLTLLRIKNATFSPPPSRLRCERAARTRIRIPHDAAAPLQFLVDGVDHASNFWWLQRTVAQSRPGLYLMAFDRDGGVLERRFVPEEEAGTAARELPRIEGMQAVLAAWRGSGSGAAPDWFERAAPGTAIAATLADAEGAQVQALAATTLDDATEFALDADTCATVFSAP